MRPEQIKVGTLLHSPEFLQGILPKINSRTFATDANNWIFQKVKEHHKEHQSVPSVAMLKMYADSKKNGKMDKVLKAAVNASLDEYEKFSVGPDTEALKREILKELKDNEIREIILLGSESKDWRDLYQSLGKALQDSESLPPVLDALDFQIKPMLHPDNLLNNWFFERQSIIALVGATGAGKSIMAFQLGIHWACGKECIGFHPQQPYRVLNIQCEDSEQEMAWERDGAIVGFSPDDLDLVRKNFRVVRLRGYTGNKFLEALEQYCTQFHPDIIFINPLLKYFGADPNDNESVNEFLNQLEPMLQRHNCGMVFVAHPKKPNRLGQSDTEYSLYGNSAWSNAVRETVELKKTNTEGVYLLTAGKRPIKLGWKEKYIRRSQDWTKPRWIEVESGDIAGIVASNLESEEKLKARAFISSLIPDHPSYISREDVISRSGKSRATVDNYLKNLIEDSKVIVSTDGRVKRYTKPSPMEIIEKGKEEF